MTPDYIKLQAQTGDVMLVKGTSLEQRAIQFACPPFCHVAQLIRTTTNGLVVVEMLEPHGYQSMSFEDWLATRKDDMVYFGQAPDVVRQGAVAIINRQKIYQAAKARKYDFDELPKVWLSHITGKEFDTDGEVCSLLVQNDWEATGFNIPGNASPGDFLEQCVSVSYIRR